MKIQRRRYKLCIAKQFSFQWRSHADVLHLRIGKHFVHGVDGACGYASRFEYLDPVRGRFVLAKLEDIAGGLQMTFTVTIEIQGEERPACVAESVVRQYFEAAV